MEKKKLGFDSAVEFSKTSKGRVYWSNIRVSPIDFVVLERAVYEASLLEEKWNEYELEKVQAEKK